VFRFEFRVRPKRLQGYNQSLGGTLESRTFSQQTSDHLEEGVDSLEIQAEEWAV
jgi:hypothetical protein